MIACRRGDPHRPTHPDEYLWHRDGCGSLPVRCINPPQSTWLSIRLTNSRQVQESSLLSRSASLCGLAGGRAVDAAAGLPAGSTSSHFRTRDALLNAVVERFAARERANWEDIAAKVCPTTPWELAEAATLFAQDATGPQRTLTLARYAILVEAAIHPALRAQLTVTGGRVRAW